ncbi:alpha/beta hydrolase [Spongiivirga sp. MCCC 1A20706]|uniref:alpha/beta fold hydrolase n=1 Tax=Spongiivirga sp. MCCC 1A20706 TaxID=3160963 RepID=UPI00397789E1
MKSIFVFLFILFSFLGSAQEKTHYFKSHDGIKIAYSDQGNGYPVVLLHGFINTRKNWDKSDLKKVLLAKGYRVIAPDLRGNGESDKPQNDEAYQNSAELKDIIALIDHLNISSYKAVGYSRGAIILTKLLTMDHRIRKAVIGGVGADFTNPKWEIPELFAKAFSGEDELNDMTRGAVTYAKSINADLKSLSLQQQHQPKTTAAQCANIEIPILIISGKEDTTNGNREALQKLLPNSTLIYVKGDHNNTYKQANFGRMASQFIFKEKLR